MGETEDWWRVSAAGPSLAYTIHPHPGLGLLIHPGPGGAGGLSNLQVGQEYPNVTGDVLVPLPLFHYL